MFDKTESTFAPRLSLLLANNKLPENLDFLTITFIKNNE